MKGNDKLSSGNDQLPIPHFDQFGLLINLLQKTEHEEKSVVIEHYLLLLKLSPNFKSTMYGLVKSHKQQMARTTTSQFRIALLWHKAIIQLSIR